MVTANAASKASSRLAGIIKRATGLQKKNINDKRDINWIRSLLFN
jgi:hypothetical protein